jgi:hypothetical protein
VLGVGDRDIDPGQPGELPYLLQRRTFMIITGNDNSKWPHCAAANFSGRCNTVVSLLTREV